MSQILNATPGLITSVQANIDNAPWTTPENAETNDGNYAQCNFTLGAADQRSEQLRATGYAEFADVGDDDVPFAIEVTVDRALLGSGVQDASVRLVFDGAPIGEDKALVGEWPGADTEQVYGAVDEDWGVTLTAAMVKDPTFGVQLVAVCSSGTAPIAQVDAMLMSLYFMPASTSSSLNSRVQEMVRSISPSREGPSTIEVNEAISEAYMHVGAIMPQALGEHVGSLVIPGGAATFQLPVESDGHDSAVEYAGQVTLRRQHDGRFLFRVSNEEMDRKTDGFGSIRLGVTATYFSLYTDPSGVVRGRCFPRPRAGIVCDVFSSTVLDDPRDAEDFDAVVAELTPQGQAAVVYRAAGMLAAARSPSSRTKLGITSQAIKWIYIGDRLAYRAAARAHDVASVGRLIREQYQRGPTVPSSAGGVTAVTSFPTYQFGLMLGNVLIVVEDE